MTEFMGALEIFLLVAGCIIFVVSFVLPQAGEEVSEDSRELAKDEIKTLVSQEMDGVKSHVDDVVDEAVEYAMEKTERALERLTNEKIMAVNEYSDTVLQEIHKNHEEVMFLYDMLNSKHINLKNAVSEVNKAVKEAEESKREAEAAANFFQKQETEAVVQVHEPGDAQAFDTKDEPVSDVPDTQTADTQANLDISFTQDEDGQGRNSNEKILELYKQGKSNVAIAKELGLGVGEVKLVIGLYKNV